MSSPSPVVQLTVAIDALVAARVELAVREHRVQHHAGAVVLDEGADALSLESRKAAVEEAQKRLKAALETLVTKILFPGPMP